MQLAWVIAILIWGPQANSQRSQSHLVIDLDFHSFRAGSKFCAKCFLSTCQFFLTIRKRWLQLSESCQMQNALSLKPPTVVFWMNKGPHVTRTASTPHVFHAKVTKSEFRSKSVGAGRENCLVQCLVRV